MTDTKNLASKPTQDVYIGTREKMSVTGIKEILNFDDASVNLKTICGDLSIEGQNIHITVLNIEKGEIELNGRISAVYYYDNTDPDKRSLLSRIFR